MKNFQYIGTLLSDVVLSFVAATEGFKRSLDYIPGSKFLGIVANKLYDEENPTTLDLFHNGQVSFGDAHPYLHQERSYKVPTKWFYSKGRKLTDKIYLHVDMLPKEIREKEQPKQARSGYFTANGTTGHLISVEQNFTIKSAYDAKKRRSKDAQMYGYFALKKGTQWAFTIEASTMDYANIIKDTLEGKHRLGRSKSAEYGLIDIAFEKEITKNSRTITDDEVYLYADSNLCFYDKYGRNTLKPSIQDLNLPTGSTILWEKSQLRTRLYQTWNGHRKNRDGDRMIIEKGAVFAVKLAQSISSESIENGVGAHINEGFGKILVNPSFLQSQTPTLNLTLTKTTLEEWQSNQQHFACLQGTQDKFVLNYLKKKHETTKQLFTIDEAVNETIKTYPTLAGISSSQWGMIRNYAKYAQNNETLKRLLFDKDIGCLYKGQSEKVWRKKNRRDKLEEILFKSSVIPKSAIRPFAIKLTAQLAKSKS